MLRSSGYAIVGYRRAKTILVSWAAQVDLVIVWVILRAPVSSFFFCRVAVEEVTGLKSVARLIS